jgi:hypothetical protein
VELTQELLKEALNFDNDSGLFTWKTRPLHHFKNLRSMNKWNTRYANTKAGSLQKRGYIEISLLSKSYTAHRLAWLYMTGNFPENQIDHINCIKTDNRFINLRQATNAENAQNKIKSQNNNKTTGLLGSCYDKRYKKYASQITINYKCILLGRFNTAKEAHDKYIEAKRKYHCFNTL